MVLVDGHNLIGRGLRLPLDREAEGRRRVVERLGAWASGRREPVVVVFDGDRAGGAKARRVGALSVVYSPAGRTADEEILRRLGRGNPRAATVVTSDRRLADRARALGARVEPAEGFWARVWPAPGKGEEAEKPDPGEAEVEEWLRVFRERKY
ncbi:MULTISPECIES: NYN domain-containing protein [Deferrisoma]